jgi:RNA polymerase sigma factor (sigma-70 family)
MSSHGKIRGFDSSGLNLLMSYQNELTSLESVAARLPFAIDESHRVNETFAAYMHADRVEDKRLVDLWTYCYVRRYFLIKFIKQTRFRASELDHLVERTYRKVERSRHAIKQHDRYAQWVSVVCRNTFINFVARRKQVVALKSQHDVAEEPVKMDDVDVNAAALHASLLHAIVQLPPFRQATARMRFVENLSNEEIARIVGKRPATVRAYVHKICTRFRRDKGLKAWAEYMYR